MIKKDKTIYTNESIESLEPLEFTRLKPNVYCGSTEYSTQLLVELIANSIDEYSLGHGNKIEIETTKECVKIKDCGQGIPTNVKDKEGRSVLERAFSVLNTSGKYREDGTYGGGSLGTYGIGAKLATYLSHKLIVESRHQGKSEQDIFIEGKFSERKLQAPHLKDNGIYVEYYPSEEFFNHTEVNEKEICNLIHTIVCLCKGLTITYNKNTYIGKNGLHDLLDEAVKEDEIGIERFIVDDPNISFGLTFSNRYSSSIVPYVNVGLTEKGPHITQIKTMITREFNKFFKTKGWLKEKDKTFAGDEIQEGMYVVFNITAKNVKYDAQVKTRIEEIDMGDTLSILSQRLNSWMERNEKDFKEIFDKANGARKAKEAAKKARDRVRKQQKEKKQKLQVSSKLADCSSSDRSKCEIFITEGDSASGHLKAARNKQYQAVFPVRGKILNTQKASVKKILDNLEVSTMIEAFGLDFNPETMKCTYDKSKLRYGKIIIASDADVDGAHIKNLFYTFIWNLCPELILNGHIYSLYPPLYVIREGKDKRVYLKDDNELADYKEKHKGQKYEIGRFKGLGEQDEDEAEATLLNPQNRNLKKVKINDKIKTEKLFEDLMGTKVIPKKEYVQTHSKEATYFG